MYTIHILFAENKDRGTVSFREDSNWKRSIVSKIRIWGPRLLSTKLAICHGISHEMEAGFRLRSPSQDFYAQEKLPSPPDYPEKFSVTERIFRRCFMFQLIGTPSRWCISRDNVKFESLFYYNHPGSRKPAKRRLILQRSRLGSHYVITNVKSMWSCWTDNRNSFRMFSS